MHTSKAFRCTLPMLRDDQVTNLRRWAEEILARPAVQRGRIVNRLRGPLNEQLHERHDASDFDTRTQDKIAAASE